MNKSITIIYVPEACTLIDNEDITLMGYSPHPTPTINLTHLKP